MSTGAILPISSTFSSPDYGSSSATASQLSVFNNLLNQLQRAAGSGNIDQTAGLLNAVEAISPSSAGAQSALGNFLTSLGTAVNDNSSSEAQAALATYQNATPASTSSTPASTSTSSTAAQIAAGLVQGQLQLSEVTSLLSSATGAASSGGSSSDSSQSSLCSLLSAAYPQSGSSSSSSTASNGITTDPTAKTATSPYETLVAALQANLAGNGSAGSTALAYLQSSGNFVNAIA
jgi:hypothetical protein